jgi:hypothetical protein
MRLRFVLPASLLAMVVMSAVPHSAAADDAGLRVARDRIRETPQNDTTVRIGAALSLGASNDDGAADPLCGALNDSNEVVRQAVAVALKRLNRPKTLGCLKGRLPIERNEATKVAITRAIEAISSGAEGSAGNDTVRDNPNAKYYISLSSVANATGRSQGEVERIVASSIRKKLDQAGVVQLAPTPETPDRARDVMKSRKLKGFYLAIAVDQFDYKDGNLRVKVKIGVFNYPNKALLGNVDKTLTAQGVSSGDRQSEDRLMELAAGLASEQFAQNAAQFL